MVVAVKVPPRMGSNRVFKEKFLEADKNVNTGIHSTVFPHSRTSPPKAKRNFRRGSSKPGESEYHRKKEQNGRKSVQSFKTKIRDSLICSSLAVMSHKPESMSRTLSTEPPFSMAEMQKALALAEHIMGSFTLTKKIPREDTQDDEIIEELATISGIEDLRTFLIQRCRQKLAAWPALLARKWISANFMQGKSRKQKSDPVSAGVSGNPEETGFSFRVIQWNLLSQ
ncbi:unnamed protein product, partial [Notodromas monacha]